MKAWNNYSPNTPRVKDRQGAFMSLTEEMIIDYLLKVQSLKAINNHEVKDEYGLKTGQTPLTIQVSKQRINQILEQDSEREQELLTQGEKDALINLHAALDSLPTSMSYQSLRSLFTGLDYIQNNLLTSVTVYLANITLVEDHKPLLKAVVLVLKIIEYDLSKSTGPITVGIGFFSKQILSAEQRIENHGKVQKLLTGIIEQYDQFFEQEQTSLFSLVEGTVP